MEGRLRSRRWSRVLFGSIAGGAALASACSLDARSVTVLEQPAPDAGQGGPQPRPPGDAAVTLPCAASALEVCAPVSDCGCDGTTQTCAADSSGRRSCRNLSLVTEPPYAACSADSDCPRHHSCLGGACKAHCVVAADCGWPNAQCTQATAADAAPVPAWSVCTRHCDLVSPGSPGPGFQACGPDVHCLIADSDTDCVSTGGTTQEGGACSSDEECRPGSFCFIEAGGVKVCRQLCGVGTNDCGMGRACQVGPQDLALRNLGRCCALPPDQICELVNDCGCADGQTCVSDFTGVRSCRPVPQAPAAPYARCVESSDCPALHDCIGSVCEQHCATAADCGWAGATCSPVYDSDNDQPVPGLRTCDRHCDVTAPADPRPGFQACASGVQCSFVDDGAQAGDQTDCSGTTAALALGVACTDTSECQPGLFCQDSGVCARRCEVGVDTCPAGTTCQALDTPRIVAGHNFGGCFQ